MIEQFEGDSGASRIVESLEQPSFGRIVGISIVFECFHLVPCTSNEGYGGLDVGRKW